MKGAPLRPPFLPLSVSSLSPSAPSAPSVSSLSSFLAPPFALHNPPLLLTLLSLPLPLAGKPFDPEGVAEAVEHVRALIREEVEAGVPLNRIVVGGFSQVGAPCWQPPAALLAAHAAAMLALHSGACTQRVACITPRPAVTTPGLLRPAPCAPAGRARGLQGGPHAPRAAGGLRGSVHLAGAVPQGRAWPPVGAARALCSLY